MHASLLPLLVCPNTGFDLRLQDAVYAPDGSIESGALRVQNGRAYPIRHGIPRFVDADAYVSSFSAQRRYLRKRFTAWQEETGREALFESTTQLPLAELRDRLVLDAGCGYGRFLDPVSTAGATVIGLDLSTDSIDLAQRYVGDRHNVHLIQGDLMHPPFRRDSFDAVYSIGVLHHTPSTHDAFDGLSRFVRPAGKLAVWVYAPEDKWFDDILRHATTRMPSEAVLAIGMARHLFGQGARKALLHRKDAHVIKGFWSSVMGQYDSLAPKYAFVHTFAEVESWFEKLGWTQVQRSNRRTAVTGVRPCTSPGGRMGSIPA